MLLARVMFAIVDRAARKGFAEPVVARPTEISPRQRARQRGVRGETYAYWYLRRHGYVIVARNFRRPDVKGEIDIVGYDGSVLAFVEVKTRSAAATESGQPAPEEAVNEDKRRYLVRMARHFLRARRTDPSACRFDVLAIETRTGARPSVRLHKGAFAPGPF